MGDKQLPAPRDPNHLAVIRRWVERIFQDLTRPSPQPPSTIDVKYRVKEDPLIIDAEFEVNEPHPPPSETSYPFHWEITPEELRQIRKWKGIDDA